MRTNGTPVPNRLVVTPPSLLELIGDVVATNGGYSPSIQAKRLRHVVSAAYREGYVDGYRDGHTDAERGHDERVIASVN